MSKFPDISALLDRDVYFVVEGCGDGELIIQETIIGVNALVSSDPVEALGQTAWTAYRIYRVNFAKSEVEDVSENIAIKLYDQEIEDGNPPWSSNHSDFIWQHIPASYQWGDGEQEWEPLPEKISATQTRAAAE